MIYIVPIQNDNTLLLHLIVLSVCINIYKLAIVRISTITMNGYLNWNCSCLSVRWVWVGSRFISFYYCVTFTVVLPNLSLEMLIQLFTCTQFNYTYLPLESISRQTFDFIAMLVIWLVWGKWSALNAYNIGMTLLFIITVSLHAFSLSSVHNVCAVDTMTWLHPYFKVVIALNAF